MKEFIEQERERLQGLLRLFNERGSRLAFFGEDGKHVFGDLVDSFTVTRIAPHFDPQGKHTRSEFWVMWKSLGYNNGWQYAHTSKIVKVAVEDTLEDGLIALEADPHRVQKMTGFEWITSI